MFFCYYYAFIGPGCRGFMFFSAGFCSIPRVKSDYNQKNNLLSREQLKVFGSFLGMLSTLLCGPKSYLFSF